MMAGIFFRRLSIIATLFTFFTLPSSAQAPSAKDSSATIHRLEIEALPGTILHTSSFLKGYNPEVRTMNHAFTARLKYAFQPRPNTDEALIYKGVYQGAGIAWHHFNPQLSNPLSVYIFQGATLATLTPRLSLNYEWNFGLTFGWKAYDKETNPDNHVIGSKVTAYMDADLYLRWMLSPQLDLNLGVTATHFSNGNTALPNAGLNTVSAKLSLAYYINRTPPTDNSRQLPSFLRHWSTDVVVFGAWKRKSVEAADGTGLKPLPEKFPVAGIMVNPMYNLNHWLNVGASLDMYFDRAANIEVTQLSERHRQEQGRDFTIDYPAATRQITAGLSARTELVMPYFAINFGIGHNFINASSPDFNGFYETLALKIKLSRRLFAHIGYSLYDFYYPNNLMIGIGYRFGSHRR